MGTCLRPTASVVAVHVEGRLSGINFGFDCELKILLGIIDVAGKHLFLTWANLDY